MDRQKLYKPISRRILATLCVVATLGLAIASGAASLGSRDLAMVAPADVGMDPAGLDKLTAAMQTMVDEGELAGIVTMVSRHGKLVHFETFGDQDLEAGTPMEKDAIFRIFSMTKPIAGVALMTLFEEGRFALGDPVEQYIPEFENLKVAAGDGPDGYPLVEEADHKMTIRELMSHTGGLTYGLFSRSQVDELYKKANVLDRSSTLKEMIAKLSQIPLRQQPGSLWHYSVSVDVQGYLIEVLTGKPFDQVLQERIFGPLGMKDTGFYVQEAAAGRLSRLYRRGRDGKLASRPNAEYLEKPAFLSGGGGLTSTAMDYMRFAQMVLNGGELDGVRILKPETVELMHVNQLPEGIEEISPFYRGNVFGLDFAIVDQPAPASDHPLAKGEFWWYGVAGTWFGINPTQDLIVVGMIQSMGGGGARKVRYLSKRLAYEAILDPVVH